MTPPAATRPLVGFGEDYDGGDPLEADDRKVGLGRIVALCCRSTIGSSTAACSCIWYGVDAHPHHARCTNIFGAFVSETGFAELHRKGDMYYGPMKALSEGAAEQMMPGRVLTIRSG